MFYFDARCTQNFFLQDFTVLACFFCEFIVRMTSDSFIEVIMTSWLNIGVSSLSSALWSPNLFYTHVSRLRGHFSLLIAASQLLLLLPLSPFLLLCLPSACWCSPDKPWTLLSSCQCSFSGVTLPGPDIPASSMQDGLAWVLDSYYLCLCNLFNCTCKRCPDSEVSGRKQKPTWKVQGILMRGLFSDM